MLANDAFLGKMNTPSPNTSPNKSSRRDRYPTRDETVLRTERFIRLLLRHSKGEMSIDYFIKYKQDFYRRLEGYDGLDSPFPLKVLFLTQKWFSGIKGCNGNDARITGLTKKETGEIFEIFKDIASRYPGMLRL
jgi:hypothetical protein